MNLPFDHLISQTYVRYELTDKVQRILDMTEVKADVSFREFVEMALNHAFFIKQFERSADLPVKPSDHLNEFYTLRENADVQLSYILEQFICFCYECWVTLERYFRNGERYN